jgi:hypothetical protein
MGLTALAETDPTRKAEPIVAEGKRLYRSEMASWYGTDLFFERYRDRSQFGGYFSYVDGDIAKCVFYSKTERPKVIGTVSFDSTYNVRTAEVDLMERAFTPYENEVYQVRKAAADLISRDTLFKSYKKTSLNLIPLVTDKEKKVYVLTGTSENNLVIFGNDYLIDFDKNNRITGRRKLHVSFLPISNLDDYGKPLKDAETMHSHQPETGDFITATDICTLMLYEKLVGWKNHTVASRKYVSIWDCTKDELFVLKRSAVQKILNDAQKRSMSSADGGK